MPRFEDDSDSGDIALSLPSSSSSPQIYSQAGPSRPRDVSSPTPRRYQKSPLWARSPSLCPDPRRPAGSPNDLNRDGDDDDDDLGTPLASRAASAAFHRGEVTMRDTSSPTRRAASTVEGDQHTLPQRSRSISVRLPSMDLSLSARQGPASATAATPSVRVGYHLLPGESRPPTLITPDVASRMSRWVKEIVVCNFDLERGPVVERKIMGRPWGPGEKANV